MTSKKLRIQEEEEDPEANRPLEFRRGMSNLALAFGHLNLAGAIPDDAHMSFCRELGEERPWEQPRES